MADDRTFQFNEDVQGLQGDAIIELFAIDTSSGIQPIPEVPSTGADWENGNGTCYVNQSTNDYDFSDVVNATPESICDEPEGSNFDPGTTDWDNADVEPRDQIINGKRTATGFVYFCNWIQTEGSTVRFGGNVYAPLPYKAEGFQIRNEGVPPNPSITIANIGLEITSLVNSYDDLLGCRLIRRRVLARHLDDGAAPDLDARWPDEVWFIQRKAAESKLTVTFELSTPFDLDGVTLPRRRALRYACPWVYRGEECGYTGRPVADVKDKKTSNPNKDKCGKRVTSCRLRFGGSKDLPYGGFPGLTL